MFTNNNELTEIYITRQNELGYVSAGKNNSSWNPEKQFFQPHSFLGIPYMPNSPHTWQQVTGPVFNIFSYTFKLLLSRNYGLNGLFYKS